MKIFVKSVLIGSVAIMILLSGCKQNSTKPRNNPTSGTIKVLADETFKPILDAEVAVFQSLYPNAKLDVVYLTETEALNGLFHDSTNLIITTRALTKQEMDFFESKKYFPKSLKIAIDAVALIVNPENKDTLITVGDFRKILTGSLTRWEQLSAHGVKDDIVVVFDNKNSSTVRYMLDSICQGQKIDSSHIALNTNSDVIEYVNQHRNAIGVIGVSWISDRDDPRMLSFLSKVKVMAISSCAKATPADSYQPYQAYLGGTEYPFTRDVYVINAEPYVGLATGFVAFLASGRGQRIILKLGILPATQPFRIIETKDNL
jgi:phosphate transport system substrate-binding protein